MSAAYRYCFSCLLFIWPSMDSFLHLPALERSQPNPIFFWFSKSILDGPTSSYPTLWKQRSKRKHYDEISRVISYLG